MRTLLFQIIQFFPAVIFLFLSLGHGAGGTDWRFVFFVSGSLALVSTVLALYFRGLADRVQLGMNLFLTSGAVAFAAGFYSILGTYTLHGWETVFAWILFAATLQFIFGHKIRRTGKSKQPSLKLDLCFVLAASLALSWSLVFDGSALIGGLFPLAILFAIQCASAPTRAHHSALQGEA